VRGDAPRRRAGDRDDHFAASQQQQVAAPAGGERALRAWAERTADSRTEPAKSVLGCVHRHVYPSTRLAGTTEREASHIRVHCAAICERISC
jgi:hypothetical protein